MAIPVDQPGISSISFGQECVHEGFTIVSFRFKDGVNSIGYQTVLLLNPWNPKALSCNSDE